MDGFSDLVTGLDSLEVGHLMGLRWFQLTEEPDPDAVAQAEDAVAQAEDAAEVMMLRQRRQAVWRQLKRLADNAAAHNCAFTRSEQALWDGLNVMLNRLDSRLGRYHAPKVLTMRGSRGPWQPGENEAACLAGQDYGLKREQHAVPARSCGCGFWVYWELGSKMVSAPAVAALVKGYGRTIEGKKGFRCSHASIEAIWMPTWDDPVALELEQRYQVPVYYKIGALLAMHKAPEGQRPLGDAWSESSEGRAFFYGHTPAPSRSPMPGVTFRSDAAMDTYKALTGQTGPIDQALPCKMCGVRRCGPGQDLCIRCEIRHAADSPVTVTTRIQFGGTVATSTSSAPYTWTAAVPAAGGSPYTSVSGTVPAASVSFTVTGTDALKAAIARLAGQIRARYGPAKDSGEAAPAPADSDPPPAS